MGKYLNCNLFGLIRFISKSIDSNLAIANEFFFVGSGAGATGAFVATGAAVCYLLLFNDLCERDVWNRNIEHC